MRILAGLLVVTLGLSSNAAERSFGKPRMMLVKSTEMKGRTVLRYEHDSIPEWGYTKPQKDYFYLLPLADNLENKPLHVVLHSAGHRECLPSRRRRARARGIHLGVLRGGAPG